MSISAFSLLVQHKADYDTLKATTQSAICEAGELITAITDRIKAERDRDVEQLAAFEATAADASRAAAIRRVAQQESEKIKSRTYGATETEQEAFADLLAEAETDLAALMEIKLTIRRAYDEAEAALKKIREESTGDKVTDYTLLRRILENHKEAFSRLCGGNNR